MRILVISPHADDETLGAGGTLLKYKNQGHNIFWLNVTDMKEEYGYTKERVAERTFEIKSVEKMYGFDKMFNLQLQPAKLDVYEKSYLVQKIASVIEEVKPDTLIYRICMTFIQIIKLYLKHPIRVQRRLDSLM